jgi:hypothetical protein
MQSPVNHFEEYLLAALSSDIKHISPKYFYDALTLVQKQGEWKIISKVFHYQLLAD